MRTTNANEYKIEIGIDDAWIEDVARGIEADGHDEDETQEALQWLVALRLGDRDWAEYDAGRFGEFCAAYDDTLDAIRALEPWFSWEPRVRVEATLWEAPLGDEREWMLEHSCDIDVEFADGIGTSAIEDAAILITATDGDVDQATTVAEWLLRVDDRMTRGSVELLHAMSRSVDRVVGEFLDVLRRATLECMIALDGTPEAAAATAEEMAEVDPEHVVAYEAALRDYVRMSFEG